MLEHQVPTYSSDTFFHHTVLRTCKQNHLYRHCMSHRASMGCLNIGPSLCDRGHITQMFVNLQKARVFLLFIKQCKINISWKNACVWVIIITTSWSESFQSIAFKCLTSCINRKDLIRVFPVAICHSNTEFIGSIHVRNTTGYRPCFFVKMNTWWQCPRNFLIRHFSIFRILYKICTVTWM